MYIHINVQHNHMYMYTYSMSIIGSGDKPDVDKLQNEKIIYPKITIYMYCTCMYMYDVHVSINYDKANETPDYQDSSNTVVILHVSLCIKMCSFYDLDAYISHK